MMDIPDLQVNENINLTAEGLESESTNIHNHHPVVDSSLTAFDDSINPTLKSRVNDVNDSSDDNIHQDKLINFNRLIDQLFYHPAIVALERYKPNPSSSKTITHLTGQSQKPYKNFTACCSSCQALPRSKRINICEKCDAAITYRCDSCDYKCDKYSTITTHYRDKHLYGQNCVIHCLYCDINIFSKSNLLRHYKTWHAIERKEEKNQKTIQFYILSKTADNEVYQCYKCKYSSSDRSDVKRHIRNEHDPIIQKPIDEPIKSPQQLQPTAVQQAKSTSADITPDFVSNEMAKVRIDTEAKGLQQAKKHHFQGNFVCYNCGSSKTFPTIQSLNTHRRYCVIYKKK